MKPLKYALEYAVIKAAEGLISLPPLRVALSPGECPGRLLQRVMAGRDRLIITNLTFAFPETPADIRAIADAFWRHIGRTAVEFVRARQIVPDPLGDAHLVSNFDVLKAAFAEKKGVIVVAAHYCNWEINGIILHRLVRSLDERFTAIARPMRNPRTEKWVQSRRSAEGTPTILHRQAVKESLRTLKKGEAIGILVDQNLYTGGVFSHFFGRPAATTPLAALLHTRTEAPIVFTYTRRVGEKFEIFFERIRLPELPDENRIPGWTQTINDRIEAMIRVQPELWFWIHNRWKRSQEAVPV